MIFFFIKLHVSQGTKARLPYKHTHNCTGTVHKSDWHWQLPKLTRRTTEAEVRQGLSGFKQRVAFHVTPFSFCTLSRRPPLSSGASQTAKDKRILRFTWTFLGPWVQDRTHSQTDRHTNRHARKHMLYIHICIHTHTQERTPVRTHTYAQITHTHTCLRTARPYERTRARARAHTHTEKCEICCRPGL